MKGFSFNWHYSVIIENNKFWRTVNMYILLILVDISQLNLVDESWHVSLDEFETWKSNLHLKYKPIVFDDNNGPYI